jgi:hypothetical protein
LRLRWDLCVVGTGCAIQAASFEQRLNVRVAAHKIFE